MLVYQQLLNKKCFFKNTLKNTSKFSFPTHNYLFTNKPLTNAIQLRNFHREKQPYQRERTWNIPRSRKDEYDFLVNYHSGAFNKRFNLYSYPFFSNLSKFSKNTNFWGILILLGVGVALYLLSEKKKKQKQTEERKIEKILEFPVHPINLSIYDNYNLNASEDNPEYDKNFSISNFIYALFEMDNFGSRVINYRVWEQNKNQIIRMVQNYVAQKIGTEISFEKKLNARFGHFEFENVHLFRTDEYSAHFNCAKFDLTIDKVLVDTSILHFILGKGFITGVELEGVKGYFDRRTVVWSEEELANYRKRAATFGDFEFKKFSVKDLNIDLYHPYPDRPISLIISEFKSNLFRQNWLVYDILTAEFGKGFYDGSAVLLQNYQHSHLNLNRLRFEELNYDNLTSGYAEDHPLSWVTNGKISVEFNYKVPNSVCVFRPIDEDMIPEFNKDCYRINRVYPMFYRVDQEEIDFSLSMNLQYLEADVPQDQSLLNNTVYKMIAYYSKNTEIPIDVSFSIPLGDFNGAIYPYDIQFFEHCGNSIYNNFHQSIVSQIVKISFRNLWVSSWNSVLYAVEAIKSFAPIVTSDKEDRSIANMFDQS